MNQQPSWLDRKEYPFQSRYLTIAGRQLHYIDEPANNSNAETLLFVHGTPSWSFDFRNVIKRLSPDYRCVALDHIGFGLSDKPANHNYSTPNHAAILAQFVQHLQLRNITLVMHDFGGPIGMAWALDHPALLRRLVLLNTWLWSSAQDPEYQRFSKVLRSPLLPFLYRRLNFSPRFLLRQSFADRSKLRPPIHRHFTAPFANATEREGALAFARSLLNDQEWFQQLWERRASVAQFPTLLIWGMNDRFVGPKYLEKFSAGFPNSRAVRLANAGHFPQEEEPEAVATAIKNFIAETDPPVRG
ncbi:MAG: alpha/beta fold hydrolase [Chlorobi bacterium CHB2]|nr:alpha/beta fold hydrolase [Chlorobi bacterium CHB2]